VYVCVYFSLAVQFEKESKAKQSKEVSVLFCAVGVYEICVYVCVLVYV
jgi:hypothetical protein